MNLPFTFYGSQLSRLNVVRCGLAGGRLVDESYRPSAVSFVPEAQPEISQTHSVWNAAHNELRPERTVGMGGSAFTSRAVGAIQLGQKSDGDSPSPWGEGRGEGERLSYYFAPSASRRAIHAFTLIEMLTVIAIIGIIAALSVPVIKNFGQANVTVSASRQLLDDVGRARQLAMSDRTTVYMVFVPTNFWGTPGNPATFNSTWHNNLTPAQLTVFTNMFDKQLTGYSFMAYGALGDQPGRHTWHYLAPWQSLPDGTYIPPWKFYNPGITAPGYTFYDPANANYNFSINPFSYTNTFPFPTEDSTNPAYANALPMLPYIAFNYLGQLSDYSGQMLSSADIARGQDYDQDFVGGGVDIPLAQGSIISGKDPNTHVALMGSPQVIEMPPGNSTNIQYNVIHIDPLTGRATLEYHKMQ